MKREIDTGIFKHTVEPADFGQGVRSDRNVLLTDLDSIETFARECLDGAEQWRIANQDELRDRATADWFGACLDDARWLVIDVQHIRLALKQGKIETAAVRALSAGMRFTRLGARHYEPTVRTRKRINKNLKPPPKFISDDRILEVINDPRYPTREAQARELGFKSPRSLYKRLRPFSNKESTACPNDR